VGGFLSRKGLPVIDADNVCRDLLKAGSKLQKKIVAAFGGGIVRPDGELDREALGAIVREDSSSRDLLNSMVHPEARRVLADWLSVLEKGFNESDGNAAARNCVVAIIPLVFEAGWDSDWEDIVCVAAPESLQIKRLEGRGLREDEAKGWIRAQLSVEEKMKRSDCVIFNSGLPECAEAQTREFFGNMCSNMEK